MRSRVIKLSSIKKLAKVFTFCCLTFNMSKAQKYSLKISQSVENFESFLKTKTKSEIVSPRLSERCLVQRDNAMSGPIPPIHQYRITIG